MAVICESWTLTKKRKSKEAMEMRCLRKILNKTKRDRIRNVAIGSTLKETPITPTIQERQRQRRWFGRVQGILISQIPKTLKEVKVEGKSRIDEYFYLLKGEVRTL